jgi:hypothetical protein
MRIVKLSTKRAGVAAVVLAVAVTLGGCTVASYGDRMKYLDKMASEGVAYRAKLQRQGTPPSEQACHIGYDQLRDPEVPNDDVDKGKSAAWWQQIRESFITSCMTGEKRPAADPKGVHAVTPSPTAWPSRSSG